MRYSSNNNSNLIKIESTVQYKETYIWNSIYKLYITI
jgi:hypothetical protein